MNKLVIATNLLLASSAVAQPTFRTLPLTPEAISADGRIVVGSWQTSAIAYNRITNSYLSLGVPGNQRATAVSGDGSRITTKNIGHGPFTAWTCTQESGAVPLQMPGALGVISSCVSRDSTAVGGVFVAPGGMYHSFIWTQNEGMRAVPEGSNYSTWLHAISPNGLKGVGSASSGAGTTAGIWGSTYLWCDRITIPPDYSHLFAIAMNPDMTWVVGSANPIGGASRAHSAMIWNPEQGLTLIPSPITDKPYVELRGVNDAGTIAVGAATADGGGAHIGAGVLWVRGVGLIDANTYFAAHHVPLGTATVVSLEGVSANGRVFIGRKNGTEGILIDLGPCGSADFNHDGATGTDADIEAFFHCLAGNCCPMCDSADFNYDGDSGTDQDIEAFFRVLAGGNC